MKSLLLILCSTILISSCSLGQNTLSPSHTQEQQEKNTLSGTQETAQILQDAYREEILAETLYTQIVKTYPTLSSIENVVNSEEKHSTQVGKLLDARGIVRPTDFGLYDAAYTTLSQLIRTSLTGAIEAGVMVEVGDINHLVEEYKKVEDTDVRQVFENIGGGSFNHLRAFLRLAEQNGYTVATDYTGYMTLAEISSAGSLKYKMTELLKANNLPTFGTNGSGKNS
jgi:hypothetical protein